MVEVAPFAFNLGHSPLGLVNDSNRPSDNRWVLPNGLHLTSGRAKLRPQGGQHRERRVK